MARTESSDALNDRETLTAPSVINPIDCYVPSLQRVAIIMATFNGGRFVEEQIHSIQKQTYADWVLYVRDDGSRDDTVKKLLQFEGKDQRVRLVSDEIGNLGVIENYSTLMKVALEENIDYVFFADQDDIWHPKKLATMLAAMRELELAHENKIPLLVHCNLAVVNEKGLPITDSFVKFSRLSPTTVDLGVMLCQNQVTSCACVINRTLLELAYPVPREVLMHDWWLALLASSVGKIAFIPKPLVMYRQHASNVLGAISLGQRLKELLFSPRQWKLRMEVIRRGFVQAAMLEERIQARGIDLPPSILKQINTYSQILNITPLNRVRNLHAQKIGVSANSTGLFFNLLITVMGTTKNTQPL